MTEIQRRVMEESVRSDHSEETLEQYRARQKQEEKEEAIVRETEFRQDLIRELRVANRLKAIEILTNSSITAIGGDYAFLISISTQWCGTDAEVNGA